MNNIKTNALFFAIIVFLFSAFIATCLLSAAGISDWLIDNYSIEGQKLSILQAYVNAASWLRLKVYILVVLSGVSVLFFYDRFFIRACISSCFSFFACLVKELKQLPGHEKTILALLSLLFFAALIGYSAVTPWQLDELHSWFFFVDRGFLVTAAYYPSSNNHIAYTLLSLPFNSFFSPLWSIRCVSLLSSLYVIVVFYLIVRRRYTLVMSLASVVLLMSMGAFLWYAIQGRGYVLELAGLMSLLYTVLNRPIDEGTDRLLVLWGACTCYVVPVALMPVGVLYAGYFYFLFKNKQRVIRRALIIVCGMLFFTLFLYGPVLVFSGVSALVYNPFVKHLNYQEGFVEGVEHYLYAIWSFVSGTERENACLLLLTLLGLSVWISFKGKQKVWFPLALLLIPLIQILLYPVLLFERTWLWLLMPLIWWILEIGEGLFRKNTYVAYLFGLSILLFLAINNGQMLYDTHVELIRREHDFQEVKDYLFIERHGETIMVDDEAYHLKLRFYQREAPVIHLVQSSDEEASITAVAVVPRAAYKSTDGVILRSNKEVVLYLPK